MVLNTAGEESSDEWSREWLEAEWRDLADGAVTTND